MADPTALSTERLRLRPWRPGDRDRFAALNADPLVMEWFPSTLARDESDELADRIDVHIKTVIRTARSAAVAVAMVSLRDVAGKLTGAPTTSTTRRLMCT